MPMEDVDLDAAAPPPVVEAALVDPTSIPPELKGDEQLAQLG